MEKDRYWSEKAVVIYDIGALERLQEAYYLGDPTGWHRGAYCFYSLRSPKRCRGGIHRGSSYSKCDGCVLPARINTDTYRPFDHPLAFQGIGTKKIKALVYQPLIVNQAERALYQKYADRFGLNVDISRTGSPYANGCYLVIFTRAEESRWSWCQEKPFPKDWKWRLKKAA